MYLLSPEFKRDVKNIKHALHSLLDVIVEREVAMTNKIDQLNDAIASIETGVGTLYDSTLIIQKGLEKNQDELQQVLAKLQEQAPDLAPVLEKALAINEKLIGVAGALKSAQEEIDATDALVEDVDAELPGEPPAEPEPEQPEGEQPQQ